ncbi:MAG: hypothetical protein ACREEM_35020 [Blastocatellia bacterium]
MAAFNPFFVDEIVVEAEATGNAFGLISSADSNAPELHGFEVTMSGRLVLPELHPQAEAEKPKTNWPIF